MREKAFILVIEEKSKRDIWTLQDKLDEMRELVRSTGCEIVEEEVCKIKEPTPRYYIGKGKVKELRDKVKQVSADVLIFSKDLSATQQLNIEDKVGIKTVDRTQLILDIFARHARGSEGKLQVELAQLLYLLPRLKGKGILLSRLGGGIGTRGPGEKKLEVDRRKINRRIEKLREELKEVRRRRDAIRKRRRMNEIPVIALVGYTNAGKTTLLNALTGSRQLSSNSMFTTLDPVSRVYRLVGGQKILFSDTVGFLNELPHHLIEAFKATLEEVLEATIILHVLDISHPLAKKRERAVYQVLDEIGVQDKPIITALNKIDLLGEDRIKDIIIRYPSGIPISALRGDGLDDLIRCITEKLSSYESWLKLYLPKEKLKLLKLLKPEQIIEYIPKDGGVYLRARVDLLTREKFYQGLSK